MIKYFHIIIFLMTHNLTSLKEFWRVEVLGLNEFSWIKLYLKNKKTKRPVKKYFLKWRLFNEMHEKGNKRQRQCAKRLNFSLTKEYGCEIGLGAKIGIGIYIPHINGIVITKYASIGKNFSCFQFTTIGQSKGSENPSIIIGDNVKVLSHSCIVGENLKIGNNVTIGAMSFINKNIPDNCTVYTEKTNILKIKPH